MMRRYLPLIGLLLLPLTASAADGSLYDIFREQVEKENGAQDVDEPVVEFLQRVFENRWTLSLREVEGAVQGKAWEACAIEASNDPKKQSNPAECDRVLRNIQLVSAEEQSLRVFGRQLLRVSAAQELPLTEFPGRPFHLATDLSGIVNIWRAGTGSMKHTVTGAILVRTKKLSAAEAEPLRETFAQLAASLQIDEGGVNNEVGIAQVWYYQYGALLRSGARNPTYPPPFEDSLSGPGTERQYMFKKDFKAGTYLEALWSKLPRTRDAFDPPLAEGEVVYFLFPDELTKLLPENMLVWARMDAGTYQPGVGESHWLGDAGVAWKYPVEPLLPSLLTSEYEPGVGDVTKPILGGRYPPEPAIDAFSDDNGNPLPIGSKKLVDGRGLCSMALAQRGYLCRRYAIANDERCPDNDAADGNNVISLLSCTVEGEPTVTVAGADVCRDIDWRNDQGSEERRCEVNEEETSEYELVRAQQRCILGVDDPYAGKSDEEQDALCCRLEGEAHLVECTALVESGQLKDDAGNALSIDGIAVTPKVCMEIRRLSTCADILGRDVRCPVTNDSLGADDADAIQAAADKGNGNDPGKKARITARIEAIRRYRPTCAPGTETAYKNTIGNNACYIGQCAEESLELHRLTGGRSPAGVSDGAFPHDTPETGDAIATLLRSVPATHPPLPSYRPQLIMRTLEDALCQLQGLPAATPPHLCAFSPSRRLALPLSTGAETAQSLLFNVDEQREATLLTQMLASGLGSRIGTDMQGQYLRIGTKTLSEIINMANGLLRDMNTVTFPTNMCPLSY